MNRYIIRGNIRQLKGLVIQRWGSITEDDFLTLEGRREQWAGEMLEAYGIAKDDSRRKESRVAL